MLIAQGKGGAFPPELAPRNGSQIAMDDVMTRAHPEVELALINLHYAKAEILCAGHISADMLRVLAHVELAMADLQPLTDAPGNLAASLIPAPAEPGKKRFA
jgi:hypothetical protein